MKRFELNLAGGNRWMSVLVLFVFYRNIVKEFQMPALQNGKYEMNLYTYETLDKENVVISLDVAAGNWKIASPNLSILNENGMYDTEKQLKPGIIIHGVLSNKQKVIIYTAECDENQVNFSKFYCETMKEITIGRSETSVVCYNNPLVSSNHAVIRFENNVVTITDLGSQNAVYVNNVKVNRAALQFGDTIFIMGMKIVFLQTMICINNPQNSVRCKIYQFYKPKYADDNVSEVGERSIRYFPRSPRIVKKVSSEVVELDPPPSPRANKAMPVLLTVGPSVTMGLAMVAGMAVTLSLRNSDPKSMIPSAITTVAMLVGALLWPILMQRYQKKIARDEESLRVQRYRAYITDTNNKLQDMLEYNRKVLVEVYPPIDSCLAIANSVDRRLWERMPSNDDFVDIRVGRGLRPFSVKLNVPKDRFTLEDDPLKYEMLTMAEQFTYINNAPVSIPFLDERLIGFIGNRDSQIDLLYCIITQLATLHSYDEVKLVFVYNSNEQDKWGFVKWLPHCWIENMSRRFIATNQDEVREIFISLNEVINQRRETVESSYGKAKTNIPHYVIFIAEPALVENEPVVKALIDKQQELGVTLVMLCERLNMLPNKCNTIIQYANNECSLYRRDDPTGKMHTFYPDTAKNVDMASLAKKLLNVKIKEQSTASTLPQSLTFLGMYKAGKIEDLEIKKRWGTSMSYKTLEAPIGVSAGDNVYSLNIHEKYHGPHGLIAGMTGSGKSEFIQAYILSMAINYHPHDVSFILIDYKGGGMANCFIGLPHISGTITNLSGNQIHRSLVSLKSELKRRQRIFAQYSLNHIDAYQQLWKEKKADEPLPHLVIISDEFAELKSQQPGFMTELVSTARIGRSLGVHLILATQKPSGVVDDQIWSNTRFRMCLKVLDRSDSMEMLKRPEAASITTPGRGYLQVGNNEIFEMVQSGYSGAAYIPSDTVADASTRSVSIIDNCGRVIRKSTLKSSAGETSDTHLSAIVRHISFLSEQDGLAPIKLWLPPLPNLVYIDEIEKRGGGFNGSIWTETEHWLEPVIGVYDDPSTQKQDILTIDFFKQGHLALFGGPGTGKTTFLQSLIYSIAKSYSPETATMYILDFGSRTMGYFNELPHVGDVIISDDEVKLTKLFKMINKELNARKKLFSEFGVGNIKAYIEASKVKIPAQFIIIDNISAFGELYPDLEQELNLISREGANYGIILILTGNTQGALKYKVAQNIQNQLTLQLNDKYDYISVVGQTDGLTPDNVKGRGLVRLEYPLEYQTALAIPSENESDRVWKLRDIFSRMDNAYRGSRPKNVPVVPEKMTLEYFIDRELNQDIISASKLPVGYDVDEAEPLYFDFSRNLIYTVLGASATGKTNFIKCIMHMIKKRYDWQIWLVDGPDADLKETAEELGITGYSSTKEDLTDFINKLLKILLDRNKDLKDARTQGITDEKSYMSKYEKIIVIIDDYDNFFDLIPDDMLDIFINIVTNTGGLNNHFVITANQQNISRLTGQPPYKNIFSGDNGLLLGGNLDSQSVYNVKADYQQRVSVYDPGTGYFIRKNNFAIIKTPSFDSNAPGDDF